MKLSHLLAALVVCCVTGSAAAHADTFNFSFGSAASGVSGSGTLTGSLIGTNEYLITGITGSNTLAGFGSSTIASLLKAGTATPAAPGHVPTTSDNDLFHLATGTFSFDKGGLSYKLDDGVQVNLFGSSDELFYIQVCNIGTLAYLQQSTLNITPSGTPSPNPPIVAATPEPSSLLLLGSGLLGIAGMARRRFNSRSSVEAAI